MFGKKEEKNLGDLQNKKNQIEQGTKIIGDIETKGNIRIDGEVVGNINSLSKVVLGVTSEVKGNVKAINAELEGKVSGDIFIEELLTIKESAIINGNITAQKIHMFPGAVLNGQLKMGSTSNAAPSFAEKSGKQEINKQAVEKQATV